jgi:hypothetical protein
VERAAERERAAPERSADRSSRNERSDRGRGGRDRDHDGDENVVGFGRDVPAFLSKAPPVRSDD